MHTDPVVAASYVFDGGGKGLGSGVLTNFTNPSGRSGSLFQTPS
jgi:hypothetical protein